MKELSKDINITRDEVMGWFDALPDFVKEYINEEFALYQEACEANGMITGVFYRVMLSRIRYEYQHNTYPKWEKMKEEVEEDLRETTVIARLQERLERIENRLRIIKESTRTRHEHSISAMLKTVKRRKNNPTYKKRKSLISYQRKMKEREEREKTRRKPAKERAVPIPTDPDVIKLRNEQYQAMARYEWDDETEKVRMTRIRDHKYLNVEGRERELTPELAVVISDLSKYKSTVFNPTIWPMVYEARDWHLINLNRHMLMMQATAIEPLTYENMEEQEQHNYSLDMQINILERRMDGLPREGTLFKELKKQAEKLHEDKLRIYATSVIVDIRLIEKANELIYNNANKIK